jgi:hypothetical protein
VHQQVLKLVVRTTTESWLNVSSNSIVPYVEILYRLSKHKGKLSEWNVPLLHRDINHFNVRSFEVTPTTNIVYQIANSLYHLAVFKTKVRGFGSWLCSQNEVCFLNRKEIVRSNSCQETPSTLRNPNFMIVITRTHKCSPSSATKTSPLYLRSILILLSQKGLGLQSSSFVYMRSH